MAAAEHSGVREANKGRTTARNDMPTEHPQQGTSNVREGTAMEQTSRRGDLRRATGSETGSNKQQLNVQASRGTTGKTTAKRTPSDARENDKVTTERSGADGTGCGDVREEDDSKRTNPVQRCARRRLRWNEQRRRFATEQSTRNQTFCETSDEVHQDASVKRACELSEL